MTTTWDAYHREASTLVSEAAGWGRQVDQSDDAEVLRWARGFLPRVLAHAAAAPGGGS